MATGRLTWQNVAAPDFSGAVEAQRASALAFDSAMQRLGGAVQTFDNNRKDRADTAVLRNIMQYQNADELQAAIASGAVMQGVNPDHVRVDALLKAQAQAGQLMQLEKDRQQLATSKQEYEFNKLRNPQIIEGGRLANATSQQTYDFNARNQPITLAANLAALDAQQLTNADARNRYNRGEQAYQANRFAEVEFNKLVNTGMIHDPVAIARYRTTLDPNDLGHAALLSKIDAQFKDSIIPIGAPGSYTGDALTAPQSGVQPVSGAPGINSPEAGAYYAAAVQNNPLLPTFLKGLGKLETGPDNKSTIGNNNFFNIKDVSEKGPRGYDKVEGSNDSYREFATPEEAYAEVTTLLARKYPSALTAKTPEEFANALHNGVGGAKYATDPKHAEKVVSMINQELKKAGGMPPPVATATSVTPATSTTPAPVVAAATPPVTPTTAGEMGIPGATPPPGSAASEAAAIKARAIQRTQGMNSASANVARYSGFAEAMANTKMDKATARKTVMEASPGLDPKDVDSMLDQVMGMSPLTRTPAAAAWVIANAGVKKRVWDPFNWTNYTKINVAGIDSLINDLTKDEGENVKAAVLIDEINTHVGKKMEEAEKKLTATQEQMSTTQQRMQNVPPGSAAHNALSAQLKQLDAKAGEYRRQIDARSQTVEQLYEQALQAGDPEGWAKRQAKAKAETKAAAKAETKAETKAAAKAEANPPPAAPAQPEVLKWRPGMTAAELDELKSYREYEAAQKRRAAEKEKQAKAAAAKSVEDQLKARAAAAKATEDQLKAKIRKITPEVIKTMTKDEVLGLVNYDIFHHLDRKQQDALMMRHLESRTSR